MSDTRARELGITVVTRDALRRRPVADVLSEAIAIAAPTSSSRQTEPSPRMVLPENKWI